MPINPSLALFTLLVNNWRDAASGITSMRHCWKAFTVKQQRDGLKLAWQGGRYSCKKNKQKKKLNKNKIPATVFAWDETKTHECNSARRQQLLWCHRCRETPLKGQQRRERPPLGVLLPSAWLCMPRSRRRCAVHSGVITAQSRAARRRSTAPLTSRT